MMNDIPSPRYDDVVENRSIDHLDLRQELIALRADVQNLVDAEGLKVAKDRVESDMRKMFVEAGIPGSRATSTKQYWASSSHKTGSQRRRKRHLHVATTKSRPAWGGGGQGKSSRSRTKKYWKMPKKQIRAEDVPVVFDLHVQKQSGGVHDDKDSGGIWHVIRGKGVQTHMSKSDDVPSPARPPSYGESVFRSRLQYSPCGYGVPSPWYNVRGGAVGT